MSSSTTVFIPMATLGRDPDFRMVGENGTPKCNLWVAIDHWRNGAKHTEWLDITAWRRLAEIVAERVEKGSRISIMGHLRTDVYEAKDGTKRRSLEVVADQVWFLSPKRASDPGEPVEPRSVPNRPAAA